MPSDALTALRGLDDILKLKPGEMTTGVWRRRRHFGHLAVQLAKRMGARCLQWPRATTVSRWPNVWGADTVVNGRKDDVEAAAPRSRQRPDAALVTAGGETADRALRAMKRTDASPTPTA